MGVGMLPEMRHPCRDPPVLLDIILQLHLHPISPPSPSLSPPSPSAFFSPTDVTLENLFFRHEKRKVLRPTEVST